MGNICVKCGASLAEGQAFCVSCGTRREPAATGSGHCVSCGGPLGPGSSFCTKCGARTVRAADPAQPAPPAPVQPASAAPAVQASAAPVPAARQPHSLLFKLFIMVAILFVVGGLALAGGVVYLGFRAKQKVEAVQQAYKHDDLTGMINALKGQDDKPQPLPNWKAASADLVSSSGGKVPLRESLKLIHAGSDVLRGDYESIYTVDRVTNQLVHIHASQEFPNGDTLAKMLSQGIKNEDSHRIECGRTILVADIESSAETDGYFCREKREEKHPGTTAMSLSKKTLEQLKSTGQTEFTLHEDPLKTVLKSFKNAMNSGSGASQDAASADLLKKIMNFAPAGYNDDTQSVETPAIKGTLSRVGTTDMAFPVLINDQPAQVPVMHLVLKSPESDKEGHLYVLDDADNPLIMAVASATEGHEQIIKIYWPVPKNDLEEELEKTGRAKVYDIYFDFRSDSMRPESRKIVGQIAMIMRDHPDWKLSIEGHTDNIGGDAYNLDLSKRRAANVKESLVKSFSIEPDRLTTAGFGASSPVDTNDTIEGRARNRRVELSRQ